MYKGKNLLEIGKLAKEGDEFAFLEIIERKKLLIKKVSYNDEDIYQYIILKLLEGIKRFDF